MAIETNADLRGDVGEQERLIHGFLRATTSQKRARSGRRQRKWPQVALDIYLRPFRIRSRHPTCPTNYYFLSENNEGEGGGGSRSVGGVDAYVHVSTIVTAAEVILQLCAERRRQRLVLLERRISAISSLALPCLVLEGRFPERSECQVFCRLGNKKKKTSSVQQER